MPHTGLSSSALVWCLIGTDEQQRARNVQITATPFQIGRASDAHLSLSCRSVSGRHAEIVSDGTSLWVRDLQSTNGTYVNGVRISAATQLREHDYIQFAKVVFRLGRESGGRSSWTMQTGTCDQALAFIQFDKLMSERCMTPFLQPIVQTSDQRVVAYEVLMRSRLFGLQTPGSMFKAAAALAQEAELSRLCRGEGVRAAASLTDRPHLFLNTHPVELDDPLQLSRSLRELREQHPDQPFTLEIHEATITHVATIRDLRVVLSEVDVHLAYDDFGAGQARLIELAEAPPDYLKFDMKLIQGIHAAPARQQMLATLVRMASELGIKTLAEGVEAEADSRTCHELGFELGQGFHYGRPAPAKHFATSAK